MDYKIDVIEQHPFGLFVALDVRRADPGLPESLLYLIGDGLNLPRVATGANNEEIGESARGLVQLEYRKLLGLFRLARLHRFIHLFLYVGLLGRHVTSNSVNRVP